MNSVSWGREDGDGEAYCLVGAGWFLGASLGGDLVAMYFYLVIMIYGNDFLVCDLGK